MIKFMNNPNEILPHEYFIIFIQCTCFFNQDSKCKLQLSKRFLNLSLLVSVILKFHPSSGGCFIENQTKE